MACALLRARRGATGHVSTVSQGFFRMCRAVSACVWLFLAMSFFFPNAACAYDCPVPGLPGQPQEGFPPGLHRQPSSRVSGVLILCGVRFRGFSGFG